MADMVFELDNVHLMRGTQCIIDDLSLRIPAGQVCALLGPNGAGKTTLLRLMAGLAMPSSGQIRLAGDDVHALAAAERAKRIAYVPQHIPAGLPLTVAEFVMLGRIPHLGAFTRPRAADRSVLDEVLARCELEALSAKRLDTLSGGERQRAAIARALAQQAPVLLLDEPTNHLDLRQQYRLQRLLQSLADAGQTVIEVLHDLTLAANHASWLALLDTGRLVGQGCPDQVLEPASLSRVYRWPLAVSRQEAGWQLSSAAVPLSA
ncbi:ABC transporter ATP-binding protein [Craterilacuibacter sp.]|uniref:ABC transporter ATP-binding protein n=1 Tax=Craterilacuibacter sp. TaxID=2870909 RepID=UPI003F390EAF